MIQNLFERHSLRAFFVGAGLLALYVVVLALQIEPVRSIAGSAILVSALFPVYLWSAGKVRGLPIFPALAASYSWTYGLPILNDHPALARYDTSALIESAATVLGFLTLATAVWYWISTRPNPVPRTYLAVPVESSAPIFLSCLALGCAFQVASMSGVLWQFGPNVYSLLRGVSFSLATLAVTLLSFRLGRRELGTVAAWVFINLLLLFIVFNAAGLMLAPSMALFLIGVATFTVGRGKLPLPVLALAFVVFSLLHAGKGPMRNEYWGKAKEIVLWNDPGFYVRWFSYGVQRLPLTFSDEPIRKSQPQSLAERSSLIHMLLLVQSQSPAEKPFLYGRTYEIIPELLVPRILVENKIWAHEGTYILAIYYGRQTRKATRSTTIGFGLLPEAYANFGYSGVASLALILGLSCSLVTRRSQHVPIVSFWGLFALMFMAHMIQTEHTAGVVVSSLFQAAVSFVGLAMFTMRPHEQAGEPSGWPQHPRPQDVAL